MKLLLIRHSEPHPERDAFDPPLTEEGHRPVAEVSDSLHT